MYPNLLRALFIVAVSAPSALTAVTVRPITDVGPATLQPVNPTYLTVVNPVVTTTATSKQTAVVSTPKSTSTTSKTTIIQQPPTSTTTSTTSVIISTPTPTPTTVPIDVLNGTRTTDIFATIKGIYGGLPQQVQNVTLNTTNIQCDILVGMRKQLELFLFFQIPEVPVFKKYFHTYVLPKITSVNQILSVGTQPVVALNVAFSQRGLYKLGVQDNVFDSPFTGGQAADANNLGDPGTTNWVPQFAAGNIDGVFLIASDNITYINTFKNWLLTTLTPSGITDLYELQGNIRPPPFDGHEMFGYLDGIGQPAISGFTPAVMPGQALINAGVILTGEPGDALQSARPPWMLDGSFMAFRQLKQLVPEFNKFLLDNAPPFPGYTQQQNADLLGARIIGRWKSGTPVELSPTADNPSIGPFPNLNNNFDYTNPGFPFNTDQSHCPFGAHIRKSRPRADEPGTDINAIMRAGIPYGPEVIAAETAANTTRYERGLAFVGYQSQIAEGFQFIQTQWANNVNFAPGKSPAPGFDVIFGQNHGGPKWISGTDINNPPWVLNVLKEYVISRGGEYFFSPSISALGSPISV